MQISSSSSHVTKTTASPAFKARFVKNDVLDNMLDHMGVNDETLTVLNRLASECPDDKLEVVNYEYVPSRFGGEMVLRAKVKNLKTNIENKFVAFAPIKDSCLDRMQCLNSFFERIITETEDGFIPRDFWSSYDETLKKVNSFFV